MSKHKNLIHAGKISVKVVEPKAKAEYKKYKALHLGDVSKVEKDYIKALENMEMRLLREEEKTGFYCSNKGKFISLKQYINLY